MAGNPRWTKHGCLLFHPSSIRVLVPGLRLTFWGAAAFPSFFLASVFELPLARVLPCIESEKGWAD